MKSGLYERAGVSATRSAAASANWLEAPLTNVSNVYRGFSPATSMIESCRLSARSSVHFDVEHVADVIGRLGGGDDDVEATVALAELRQRVGDQRQVTGQDPVAGERARDLDHERVVVVGLDRDDLGERREPDRLGELGAQQLGYRCPHLLLVTH